MITGACFKLGKINVLSSPNFGHWTLDLELPFDATFFRRIDLGQIRRLTKEEAFDIVE